jgi:hypothetical protein
MNERIKELMGKTLDDKFSHTWDTMTYEGLLMFSEKFAELIVGECIRKIEDIAESSNDPQPIYRVAVELLEHFGVEE